MNHSIYIERTRLRRLVKKIKNRNFCHLYKSIIFFVIHVQESTLFRAGGFFPKLLIIFNHYWTTLSKIS